MLFNDRQEAGQRLAEKLGFLEGKDVIVLAVPRGGVVVAAEVARALGAPLDVYIARKIGAPYNEELAIGAVAPDGSTVLDQGLIGSLGVSSQYIEKETARQKAEIERRLKKYRGEAPPPRLAGRHVVLVDDGVATGATTLAALRALRQQKPQKLILAVPVGPPDSIQMLSAAADQVVCLATPEPFWAVGRFFVDWSQTSDEEVIALLRQGPAQSP
ncbi:MAG: phosphoribosyltransferase [Chloroflexi bacterium]|nr:phosphoribosyltransferase [Chloroflexota bacterium]